MKRPAEGSCRGIKYVAYGSDRGRGSDSKGLGEVGAGPDSGADSRRGGRCTGRWERGSEGLKCKAKSSYGSWWDRVGLGSGGGEEEETCVDEVGGSGEGRVKGLGWV